MEVEFLVAIELLESWIAYQSYFYHVVTQVASQPSSFELKVQPSSRQYISSGEYLL